MGCPFVGHMLKRFVVLTNSKIIISFDALEFYDNGQFYALE